MLTSAGTGAGAGDVSAGSGGPAGSTGQQCLHNCPRCRCGSGLPRSYRHAVWLVAIHLLWFETPACRHTRSVRERECVYVCVCVCVREELISKYARLQFCLVFCLSLSSDGWYCAAFGRFLLLLVMDERIEGEHVCA